MFATLWTGDGEEQCIEAIIRDKCRLLVAKEAIKVSPGVAS
jgi:hypothetical protein